MDEKTFTERLYADEHMPCSRHKCREHDRNRGRVVRCGEAGRTLQLQYFL